MLKGKKNAIILLIGLVMTLVFGCAGPKKHIPAPSITETVLKKIVGYERIKSQRLDKVIAGLNPSSQGVESFAALAPALEKSLAYVSKRPAEGLAVSVKGLRLTWGQLRITLEDLVARLPLIDQDRSVLGRDFVWYAFKPNTLITGYYEPLIEASRDKDPAYPYPLYRVPDDMLRADLGRFHPRWKGQKLYYRMTENGIKPYYDREDIDFKGALANKGLELAWAKNLVDVFFLHIQGSGRLNFKDGTVKHILYAGKNGRQYVSLGRVLINKGYMTKDQVSMQSIRSFLESRPDIMHELLAENPSYVFFRLADQGPFGAMGCSLTPMVSIAVDRRYVPFGAVMAMTAGLPGTLDGFAGLVTAQDTGGAIKKDHIDLFCGSGPKAEYLAGHMDDRGKLRLLVSKRALNPGQ